MNEESVEGRVSRDEGTETRNHVSVRIARFQVSGFRLGLDQQQ